MKTIAFLPKILVTACSLLLTVALTNAQTTWTQIGSDIDGEVASDQSGYSVSLSSDGTIVAIGARYNAVNGPNTGHVRVWERNQWGIWTQLGNDIDGEAMADQSGYSVSLSSDGSVVAIGAPYNDGNGDQSGHVRVYQNVAGTWTQIGSDIDGENPGDQSGYSVSLSSDGTIVAIGAPYSRHNQGNLGHVRVYQNIAGTWTQVGSDIDGEAAGDYSGNSVSLSSDGTIVAIGAYQNNGGAGCVRVYKKNLSGNWTKIAGDIVGEAENNYSGTSVSLSSDGTIVAIGAPFNSGTGVHAGHVRVYQNILNTWTQIGNDINGEAAGDESGTSVSLSSDGSMVAIGAYFNNGNWDQSGHVRIYQNMAGTWTQIGSDIDGEAAGDYSGISVSLSSDGTFVAIGAPYNEGTGIGGDQAGHVRIFSDGSLVACKTLPDFNSEVTPAGNQWNTDGPRAIWNAGCYVYKVHLTIGKTYTFQTGCGNGATADFDTFIQVFKADGTTLITNNDDGCELARSKVSWTATETVAFVKVPGYTTDDYGTFTIACWSDADLICKAPPDYNTVVTPAGDAWTTDGPRTIVSNGCYIYKANLTVGKEYTFKTGCGDNATADFNTVLEVLKADGTTLITSDDDGCESSRSKVTFTASETSAFIRVRGSDGSESGSFTLAYEYANPVPVACKTPPDYHSEITPAENTWNIDGPRLFGSNGCYVYKVNCTVGKPYTVKTGCGDGATAGFDTFIEVYNSTGGWIAGNDDGCSDYRSTVSWTATQSVAYVKVRGYNGSNHGSFILAFLYASSPSVTCKTPPAEKDYTITPNNISWQTHPATLSETINISSGSCKIYEVTGITGSKSYTFKTGCGDGATADFDTYVELYNSDGVWLASNDDGCSGWTSIITWTSPSTYAGTVYVKVRGYNESKSGTYRMAYMEGASAPPTPCKVPPLFDLEVTPSGTWAADTRTLSTGECYLYKVTTTAGNAYTFMTGCGPAGATNPTADFDTFIELYNSAGTMIASNDDGCESWRSTIEWAATGTVYFVKIRGWRPTSYGTYTVAYSSAAGSPPSSCVTPPASDETLPIPTNGWQTGGSDNVTSDGCYIYKVAVTSSNTYTFKTGCGDGASVAADFDTFLELYDASGGWLAEDDDGCKVPAANDYTSKIVWAASYTGIAYLKIRGWNSSDFGAFTLAYSYVTTGPDALELGTGEDIARSMVKVFPNPASHSFTVASQEPLSFTKVTISEFTGKLVKSYTLDQPVTSLRIESSGFAQGVYILSIETSEGWVRKKVSIVR